MVEAGDFRIEVVIINNIPLMIKTRIVTKEKKVKGPLHLLITGKIIEAGQALVIETEVGPGKVTDRLVEMVQAICREIETGRMTMVKNVNIHEKEQVLQKHSGISPNSIHRATTLAHTKVTEVNISRGSIMIIIIMRMQEIIQPIMIINIEADGKAHQRTQVEVGVVDDTMQVEAVMV